VLQYMVVLIIAAACMVSYRLVTVHRERRERDSRAYVKTWRHGLTCHMLCLHDPASTVLAAFPLRVSYRVDFR